MGSWWKLMMVSFESPLRDIFRQLLLVVWAKISVGSSATTLSRFLSVTDHKSGIVDDPGQILTFWRWIWDRPMIWPRVTFLIGAIRGGHIYTMLLGVFLSRYWNSDFGYEIDLWFDLGLLIGSEQSVKVTFGPNILYMHISDGSTMTFALANSLGPYMRPIMSQTGSISITAELWLKNDEKWYITVYITILG